MALNISTGTISRAQKIVLYGVEGIGKTTLASKMPDPLFIDTEGGTAFMDVKRVDGVNSWPDLLDTVKEIIATPGICKTLVIDTADWAEQKLVEWILRDKNCKSIEEVNGGYGKGYVYMGEKFSEFLKLCDKVINTGINVVITAHATMRKQELPDEMGAFDRWELKLSKRCTPLLKEWADAVLFCNYKTIVITTDTNSKKAQGGRRVIYTTHKPAFDAKNRHGLPDELDMNYESIASMFAGMADMDKPVSEATLAKLKAKIEAEELRVDEVEKLLVDKGKQPEGTTIDQYTEGFVNGWLRQNWGRVVKTIVDDPERGPF
jgi:GTPase SAR1 family protein